MTATETEGYDERIAALHDRADEPLPESWQPTGPGDEIVGKFTRLDKGTTSYGPCWIVVLESIKQPGNYRSVWLFHTALQNQFNKARPQQGELILVRYEGKRKPKAGGAEYHDWKVLTEGAGQHGGFSWDEFNSGDANHEPSDTFIPPDFASQGNDDIPF